MDVVSSSTRFLRHLAYGTRLVLTTACFAVCLLLFVTGYTFSHEGSILALPIAFAAWFFKRYEPWLYLLGTILAIGLVNYNTYHGLQWPRMLLIAFLFGTITLCVEILLIQFLRRVLDISEENGEKVMQAEKQLSLAYEQQLHLNQLKDQFITNVNHELRTPLTEILGYLDLLRSYRAQLDETTRAAFIENAVHGCEDLKYLVDEVLDVSRFADGLPPPEYELMTLRSVVSMVLSQYDPRKLELHPVEVNIPEQLTVWGDRNQVKQIVRNLISNAFKYVPVHTCIQITGSSTMLPQVDEESPVKQTLICVKDAGPGIPRAQISLLFEKFVRLERDLAGAERGSGLGLYLCKQLVEGMGGKIWVESSGIEGEGSCFFFTLLSADPDRTKLSFAPVSYANISAPKQKLGQ